MMFAASQLIDACHQQNMQCGIGLLKCFQLSLDNWFSVQNA